MPKPVPSTSSPPSDPLSDIATGAGVSCTSIERWNLTHPWGIRYAGSPHAVVHCLLKGDALIVGMEDRPTRILEGGAAVLPHDVPHTLASAWPIDESYIIDAAEPPAHGSTRNYGTEATAETVLMTMPFAVRGRQPAEGEEETPAEEHSRLMKVINGPTGDVLEIMILAGKLVLMPGIGDRYVACRLAEAILAKLLVRASGAQEDTLGLFSLFASVGVRQALSAIEGDVAHAWTIGELAEVAGTSRKRFAAEFQDTVGMPVGDFVGMRRVRAAERSIAAGLGDAADVAASVGFRSLSAFKNTARRVVSWKPLG